MPKLKDQEFKFLIDLALDTKDEEMFKDLMKRQEEGSFLDFPKEQQVKKEVLSFADTEKERLLRDLQVIINSYKHKTGKYALQGLIDDVEQAINYVDERIMDHEMKEEGIMPLKFPPSAQMDYLPTIQYMAVSYETAMEAFDKHSFPNETLDDFVARYFFNDEGQDEF